MSINILMESYNKFTTIRYNNDPPEFINNTIIDITQNLIKERNITKIILFISIVRRIEKNLSIIFLDQNNIDLILLIIASKLETNKYKNDILDNIIKYINDKTKDNLNELFICSIKLKQYGIIDRIKYYVNIVDFVDSSKNVNFFLPSEIVNIKAIKLYNLFWDKYKN
jgi:hypothetical protein